MSAYRLQLTVAGLLLVVACVALNLWLFRVGPLWGIIGLNVTKHVVIAWLCQAVGLDRDVDPSPPSPTPTPRMPSGSPPAG